MQWLTLIIGLLKFPKELTALIKLLSKTPSEKHEEIMKKITAEQIKFDQTGRPTW